MTKKLKELLSNPRLYVPYWFNSRKLDGASEGMQFDSLWLDYRETVLAKKDGDFKGINEKDMQKAFNEYLLKMPLEKLKNLAESLISEGENLEPLKAWTAAVAADNRPEDVQVMAHWCWLVKRKALGLPVIHHIMPVIVGPQGSGKTIAISKLIGPLEASRMTADVPMLSEQSTYQSMSNHLVIMFDELAGIQRMDMNVLKRQISTESNTFRPLYKQQMVTVPQRCSFIGASNTHIDESIFDSTGMRRFYQIISPKRVDWNAINAVDYKALWLGIDEQRPDGYLTGEALSRVHEIQHDYAIQDDIDMFIKQFQLMPDDAHKDVEARLVWEHYKQWARESNVKFPLSLIMFNKKMRNRGIRSYERRSGNSRIKCYEINVDSQILAPTSQAASVLTFNTGGA